MEGGAARAGIAPALAIGVLGTMMKLLVMPAYRSTDFEVHRNWLAVTHSLPLERWYYENTSEWTLDYPPFFAWFEYGLSALAALADKEMLRVSNLNYASAATITFQRLSVITLDLWLLFALHSICTQCGKLGEVWLGKGARHPLRSKEAGVALALAFLNPGLFLVDHVHFQYNGFLFGFLIMSMSQLMQGNYVLGAVIFAVLLNMKHIFLYFAPLYFVFLLRHYCWLDTPGRSLSIVRLLKLGVPVLGVFGASFGPFVLRGGVGQVSQILARMFPFGRGLCHAYWAPNIWALYNVGDKAATIVAKKLGVAPPSAVHGNSFTGGLVHDSDTHALLPSVTPRVTLLLTILALAPALHLVWKKPLKVFMPALIYCGMCFFMLSWHVHEKAILMVTLPLSVMALHSPQYARLYLMLATTGHFSLLPLLFEPAEWMLKFSVWMCHSAFAWSCLDSSAVTLLERVYVFGLLGVELAPHVLDTLLQMRGGTSLLERLPFLPLLMYSTYCAMGVTWCWYLSWRACSRAAAEE